MPLARGRRISGTNYWPGFVDAMATLLLVIIFLLSVFMIAQFFLSQEISGRDTVLSRLNSQIAELTELLALERANSRGLSDNISILSASLADEQARGNRLQGILDAQTDDPDETDAEIAALNSALEDEQRNSQRAVSQVELLNQQIAALRRQIGALESALEASEDRDRESQTQIADLGRRLNLALAQRVQELSRFRSDFFGRLREILTARSDIQIVGDRFVFQSEVFFSSGQAEVNPDGQLELEKLANALNELEAEIPDEIDWVLRVDGHTDRVPLSGTGEFRDNWDLSAGRAISVVQFLIDQGVPPRRLVAAGFGEFRPLDPADTDEAYRRNRRIELKLTQR
ncbi:MAG: peptidoglycan -binding protein [Pseudomonadota bacterium]